MILRIIVAATLVPIVAVVAAIALYFAMGWGNSESDSGHITFYSDRDGDGVTDGEYLMNAHGSGVTQLTLYSARFGRVLVQPLDPRSEVTQRANREVEGGPRLFSSDNDGDLEIYVLDPDESGVTLLTRNEASNEYVYQTPDGIVSYSGGSGGFLTHLATKYGFGTQLTDNEADDTFPSWLQDGRISFISDRDGDFEIYVMNSDGSGVTQLTHNQASDGIPSWSPDERRIAFTSDRDGDFEIYVMNSDGSSVTQLTRNDAVDSYGAWSPDGQRIAFASDRDGDFEIYIMNPDGSDVRQLTHNETNDFLGNWLPESAAPSPG